MSGVIAGLKKYLKGPVKSFLEPYYFRLLDLSDAGERRKEMIPPRTMNFVGNGDFKEIGLEFRRLFVEHGGLKPNDRVLDVGCGIGRMAVPLTTYLSADGEYEGFDIVKMGVEWCQKNITPRYPNFHFAHADVQNKDYNPGGTVHASSYKFPYETGSFDFIFLTSVFTHMFPPDMMNYLGEISRVLKLGGTCFITFFLLNEESQGLIEQGLSTQNFVFQIDGCVTTTPGNPEAAIAFSEPYVREAFDRYGLSVTDAVRYGSWCGRAKSLSYQDIVVATKD